MSATTPAAVISRASTPLQRTVTAPLGELADRVREAALRAPSLIVVGTCVERREARAWFESRPLLGKRIGITRPDAQADPQIARALSLGAEPILMPTITIEPLTDWSTVDTALQRITQFDWLVFTSVNGVRALLGRLWRSGGDARQLAGLRLAAIGPATAEALAEFHLRADVVPDEFRAEGLADALRDNVSGRRILWARASRGRDVLPRELKHVGAEVEEIVVYRNEDADALPPAAAAALEAGEVDWIGLSSPSIARQFAALIPDAARAHLGRRTRLAAISPVTQAAAEAAGLPVAVTAESYTWDGVFDAILREQGFES
jgi:uroporphyrinogen III methyltransferase/synthase